MHHYSNKNEKNQPTLDSVLPSWIYSYGREDYPHYSRLILDRVAHELIVKIEIRRTILPTIISDILDEWTSGLLQERLLQSSLKSLYHISMLVVLANNSTILLEKNEVIGMRMDPSINSEEYEAMVVSTKTPITFVGMMNNTRQSMGDSLFFSYDAKANNCGTFIETVLQANGLETEITAGFITQDAQTLLDGFQPLHDTINKLTAIAGTLNYLIQDGGIPSFLLHGIRDELERGARSFSLKEIFSKRRSFVRYKSVFRTWINEISSIYLSVN